MSQVLQQMQLDHLKNNITTLQRDVKMIDVRTEQIRTEGEELNKMLIETRRILDGVDVQGLTMRVTSMENEHARCFVPDCLKKPS